jgi:predicted LPLAT superfamily acyltransferase
MDNKKRMKMKNQHVVRPIVACAVLKALVIFMFIGCSSRTQAADKPTENQGANAMDAKIREESKGLLRLVKFTKTNGQKANVNGIDMYTMECTVETIAIQDCVMTEFPKVGWEGNFKAIKEQESPPDELDYLRPIKRLAKDAKMTFTTSLDFELTERGWRTEGRLPADKPFVPDLKSNQSSTDDIPALWQAAAKGDTEAVKLLLEEGADVNMKRTSNGTTALSMASQNGHTEVVRLLLEKGADVNVKTTENSTALFIAAEKGQIDIVKLLLGKGADVNTKHTTGATALLQASAQGHAEIVRLLLKKGADVNVKITNTGSTALLLAAEYGHTEVVKLLLAAKADVNAKASWQGKDYTPLSIAKEKGNTQIIELLEKAGAKE